MIVFPPYSRDDLMEILDSRVRRAFKEGMLEEGAVELCARLVYEKTGDARKALDLLRLSGEVANERRTVVNEECVLEALERVERDWVFELVRGLPLHSAVILGVVASLSSLKSTFSVRELYDYYKSVDFEGRDMRRLGERRVAEILTELETIGIIGTWNVSRGRYGYHKLIKLNVDPRGVLDLFADAELDFGFVIEHRR